MDSVVSDTHAFVWYILEPERLSTRAVAALDGAATPGAALHLPSIALVEICYLMEKGRLSSMVLQRVLSVLRSRDRRLRLTPLNLAVARAIPSIPREQVPDMPDRIIAATALSLGLPLVTRDGKIRASSIETIW